MWGGTGLANFVALNMFGPGIHSIFCWTKKNTKHVEVGLVEENFRIVGEIYSARLIDRRRNNKCFMYGVLCAARYVLQGQPLQMLAITSVLDHEKLQSAVASRATTTLYLPSRITRLATKLEQLLSTHYIQIYQKYPSLYINLQQI